MESRSVCLGFLQLVLLCWPFLVCSKSCSLWVSPKHPLIPYGNAVLLNCSASCSNYNSLNWETSVKKNLTRGDQWVALYIANQSAWMLTPQCYLIDSNGSVMLSSVNILFYTFTSPEIHLRDEIVADQEERVTCRVSSSVAGATPSDINLTLSDNRRLLALSQGLFLDYNFTASANHDRMQLLCTARLQVADKILVKSQAVSMTVFYKPTNVSIWTELKMFRVGQNFTMRCHSVGNPVPSFIWHLPSNESVEVASDRRTVSVYSAKIVHNGTYECKAINKYGVSTARANIIFEENVSGSPKDVPPWAIAFMVLFGLGVTAVAAFLIRRALI